MSWHEEMRARAQEVVQENDLEKRTKFVGLLGEVAWGILLTTSPVNIHSCYTHGSTTFSHPGVDLTEADEYGDLWMSYLTAPYTVDLEKIDWLVQLLQQAAATYGITWNIPIENGYALLNPNEGLLSAEEIFTLCKAFTPHLLD